MDELNAWIDKAVEYIHEKDAEHQYRAIKYGGSHDHSVIPVCDAHDKPLA